jgi:hypothetical protein
MVADMSLPVLIGGPSVSRFQTPRPSVQRVQQLLLHPKTLTSKKAQGPSTLP